MHKHINSKSITLLIRTICWATLSHHTVTGNADTNNTASQYQTNN